MTTYLHLEELNALSEDLICMTDDEIDALFERSGVCSAAVHSLADEADKGHGALGDAYIAGILLGLLAAEKVGR